MNSDFDPAFHVPFQDTGRSAITAIRRKIRAWVRSAPLRDLLEMFEADIPMERALDEVLERLELFSDRWDFRRIAREQGVAPDDAVRRAAGSARWLSAATGLNQELEARVVSDAKGLGLVHAQDPTQAEYDYIVVLGGARLSCKLRPLRAAEVLRAGVAIDKIALLGAARPIADSERDATDTYVPGATDEFDLIVAGAQQAFGFDADVFDEERHDDSRNRNLSWVIRRFRQTPVSGTPSILAISAPSSDPQRRRANSADTILFLLDRERIKAGTRLLLITSQIYVPYVQLEALRTVSIPRNVYVETIGFPGDRMPELQGLSSANHYLQETRSAIQAARRFCLAYAEADNTGSL